MVSLLNSAQIAVDADQTTVTAEENENISDLLLEDCQNFIEKGSKTSTTTSHLNSNEFYSSLEDGKSK